MSVDFVDVSVFSGAGGMCLGLQEAGFDPALHYELDESAWTTLKSNGLVNSEPPGWQQHKGDVREADWSLIEDPVRLLAGGVPCQPFSLAGRHRADRDERDRFPEFTRAMRILRPQAVIVENVYGLLRDAFQPYFNYILARLECPSIHPREREVWEEHHARIRRFQRKPGYEPEYIVSWRVLNSADYGVPQNRRRVFIVATRYDLPFYRFPKPTHSRQALLWAQRCGEYWEQRDLPKPAELPGPSRTPDHPGDRKPWATTYDAINSLPDPASSEAAAEMNHWVIPGARSYPGHTGSHPHWPSKTIKAGVHGVPGGENTLALDGSGTVRYYTLREAARIQTFPDSHVFSGARVQITKQIGNAVPCRLAEAVATPLHQLIETAYHGST